MKKHLMIFAVALLTLAIVAPAFAAVEFKYGGNFRVRWFIQDNVFDGTDRNFTNGVYNSVDNRRMIDQRLRLYFTFQSSKNLKLVTAFEMGDAIWGQGSNGTGNAQQNTGANLGANLGGDSVSVEVKNVFIDFNIPNTPTKAIIGLQPLVLMDSWIVGDDLPAAVFVTKLDPFKITLGYVGGQNGWERVTGSTTRIATTDDTFNVDDFFLSLDYASGPFKASLIGFLQFGHDSMASLDPSTLFTPIRGASGNTYGFFNQASIGSIALSDYQAQNNMLFDLGLNLTYKVDWLLAYVNFVKNLGSVDQINTSQSVKTVVNPLNGVTEAINPNRSVDYTGWMVDAGVTYFCGPWTANIGGFYTSGPDIADNLDDFQSVFYPNSATLKPFRNLQNSDADWFTYPLGVQKATSEIIGGGILGEDLHTIRGYDALATAGQIGQPAGVRTVMWKGWYNPQNVWSITAGGSYQATPSTKISASYWYWGTSSDVPVALYTTGISAGNFEMSNSIGHELNLYIDQKIVDGLTLTLVGAYLFANEAFAPIPTTIQANGLPLSVNPVTGKTNLLAEDAFEVGARLQWSF